MSKGILLVNLGTPDSPSVADVRKYLAEFLMDGRVIDIHPFLRFLLVRGIIVPFRAPKSARLYQEIWDPQTGSPLLYNSRLQQELLQQELGDEYVVELAMRYQQPSIADGLAKLKAATADEIQIIPLFPQYASATNGSVIAEVMRVIRTWHTIPPVTISGPFYNHRLFIRAFAAKARRHDLADYDHTLFSFHGLPLSHLRDCAGSGKCGGHDAGCCQQINSQNKLCYAAQCHESARLIAAELQLNTSEFTICFQSRLGKQEWIQPYTSTVIQQLAAAGKKSLLVLCPAFISDCLETIQEIGAEYRDEFIAAGGEQLQLVESLNDSRIFIRMLREIGEGSLAISGRGPLAV